MRLAPGDDLQVDLHGCGPASGFAGVDGVGPDQADAAAGAVQFHSSGRAASGPGRRRR